ncbi:hypothetical protein SAMD00019534_113030, partial [Acytostelium subglobosum LB1]|uniref:hypothetical protein n=1 Tax=Acytostelium subglobosum LB1 TaxID=1410327 RepID=UPI000644F4D6
MLSSYLCKSTSSRCLTTTCTSLYSPGATLLISNRSISKSVPIILTQEVAGVGQTGEELTVSKGYARNFFFLKGLAVQATHETRKQYEEYTKNIDYSSKRTDQHQQMAMKKLKKNNTLLVMRKPKTDGTAAITITNDNIAYSLKRRKGIVVDPQNIEVDGIMDTFGLFNATVNVGTLKLPLVVRYEAMMQGGK